MKIIISILIIILSLPAFSKEDTCDNAPNDAMLEFKKPYNKWLKITCDTIKKSHLITSQDGYTWNVGNTNKSFSFNAYSPYPPKYTTLELNIYEPHKYYFKQAKSLIIQPNQLDGLNQMLSESNFKYKEVYQHDVMSSTKTVYNFFIFVNDDEPEWIIACHSYNCSKAATIEVNKQ
ncbi:MAG: hypothetical protein HRU38_21855 [Saccharospirillaceae bacterium]|nr:hypothetical protein [Pseudomonadales bacterium]NRB81276.1 hypothetical protein [Saccharospirillaceae bacterium]